MKRWLGLFLVLLAAMLVTTVVVFRRFEPTYHHFEKIQPGMTRAEVIRLMGKPDHETKGSESVVETLVWKGKYRAFEVSVDSNEGIVLNKKAGLFLSP